MSLRHDDAVFGRHVPRDADGLARYGLAGAFPLFTVQMCENLGIGWASSPLGFIALVLGPVPWVLFKFGKRIRARSRYETASW